MLVAGISITSEGKRYSLPLLVTVAIFLALFAGLNTDYPDLWAYRVFFEEVSPIGDVLTGQHNFREIYGVEWGFLVINSLIKFFFDTDIAMFVVIALITVLSVAYVCRNLSPYPVFSMLCYYSWTFYSTLGGLRHALASAAVMLMVLFICQRKQLFAVPTYFASASFHRSGAAAAAAWFMVPIARHRMLFLSLITLVIGISIAGGIGHMLADTILPFTGGRLHTKLSRYSEAQRFSRGLSLLSGSVMKQVLLTTVCLYYFETLKKKFSSFPVVFGAYALSFVFFFLLRDFAILGNRVSHLFIVFEIILIPMVFSLFSRDEKILLFLFISVCLYYQFSQLVGTVIHPYTFVLTPFIT